MTVREEGRGWPGEAPSRGLGRPPTNRWQLEEIAGAGRALEHLLGSRTRARLFACLLLEPGRELWLRQIQREVRTGARSTQRELSWMCQVGLIRSERRGQMRFFRANEAHPLCSALRTLIAASAEVDGSPEGRREEPPRDFRIQYN